MSSEVVIRVEVTAEDIEHGEAGNCNNCPVAKAVDRRAGRFDARVGSTYLYFGEDPDLREIPIPKEATAFIRRFDDEEYRGRPHNPFSFDLSLPAELVLKGGETCKS